MNCPKCKGVNIVTDRDLDPPHTCTDCWRAFDDSEVEVLGADASVEDASDFVPDAIGEIIGWRAWYIVDTEAGVRLKSLGMGGQVANTVWTPGEIMYAECPNGHATPHLHNPTDSDVPWDLQCPQEKCSCGFYTASSKEHLLTMTYHTYDVDLTAPKCIGQVALAGKVIPGTQGWRASQVWATKLLVPFEFWRYVKPLQEAYGIPVELSRTLFKR